MGSRSTRLLAFHTMHIMVNTADSFD